MNLNVWILLFMSIAMLSIFFAIIFWRQKTQKRVQYFFLATYLFVQAVILLEYCVFWSGMHLKIQPYPFLFQNLNFLVAPLLLLFLRNGTPEWKTIQRYSHHFFPFALSVLLRIAFAIGVSNAWIQPMAMTQLAIFLSILFSAQLCYYVLVFWRLREENSGMLMTKKWFGWVWILYVLYVISVLCYYVLSQFAWFNPLMDYQISLLSSASTLLLVWYALILPEVYEGNQESTKLNNHFQSMVKAVRLEPSLYHDEKYRHSGLTTDALDAMQSRLNQIMHDQQLYRDPDIRLDALAEKLGVSRHHLSQLINDRYQMHYFDYINSLRIEEAMQLLSKTDKKKLNVIEVAYLVGYSNKVTFNASFKKIAGMSPTEFRKQKGNLLSD